jgi:hypothetical protein
MLKIQKNRILNIENNKKDKKEIISIIEKMSDEEKEHKIKELCAEGYEYNEFIHILIKEGKSIPYNFIMLCLLVEDKDNYR